MMNKDANFARGYIASGEFNGNRTPQHIQNQIVKSYCDSNCLQFVLSRAEYWINGSTHCQLWAALKEGLKHIVFYSIWQLPVQKNSRNEIYKHCIENRIILHFAVECMRTSFSEETFFEIETLFQSNLLISKNINCDGHFDILKRLVN